LVLGVAVDDQPARRGGTEADGTDDGAVELPGDRLDRRLLHVVPVELPAVNQAVVGNCKARDQQQERQGTHGDRLPGEAGGGRGGNGFSLPWSADGCKASGWFRECVSRLG